MKRLRSLPHRLLDYRLLYGRLIRLLIQRPQRQLHLTAQQGVTKQQTRQRRKPDCHFPLCCWFQQRNQQHPKQLHRRGRQLQQSQQSLWHPLQLHLLRLHQSLPSQSRPSYRCPSRRPPFVTYQVVAKRNKAVVVVLLGMVKVNVPAVIVWLPNVCTLTALFDCVEL